MSDLVLMTGASGFLGRCLLRTWLQETTARVVACVRPRNGRSPAGRLALAVRSYEPALREAYDERVFVLPADLAKPDLGLDDALREELASTVTHIVHCGGVVRFDLPLAAARATNTVGTAAMLALARRCVGLRRFDHISTAYVAGCRQGLVREDELDCGQDFHNHYERSKFEGERLLRAVVDELPVTIHRPSVVTCDRPTGELSAHGAVARLLGAYATGRLTGLPGRAEARLDLVPADFVAKAVFALSSMEETLGRCYHLAAGPERSVTLGEVRDLAAASFGLPPLRFDENGASQRVGLRAELELYAPYLNSDASFDVTGSSRALRDTEIAVPALAEYFDQLARGIRRRH